MRRSMRVLVAYESRGGTTRRTGEAIARAARGQGHAVTVGPLADVAPAEVGAFDAVFVGAWIEGFILFGVRPARAAIEWVRRLPPLEGKPVAVFCTYAFNPRGSLGVLTAALEDKGARVVDGHAFHRRDPEAGVEGFVVRALAAAGPEGPGSATTGGPEPR